MEVLQEGLVWSVMVEVETSRQLQEQYLDARLSYNLKGHTEVTDRVRIAPRMLPRGVDSVLMPGES